MSERNVERILKKYGDAIREDHPDLPATIYPHMLRRTRGTRLYRDGIQIEAIAVTMGHLMPWSDMIPKSCRRIEN